MTKVVYNRMERRGEVGAQPWNHQASEAVSAILCL